MATNGVMVGVIGGTGLGEALGAVGLGRTVQPETPFGRPSGPITLTEVAGVPVALLARHGVGHVHSPTLVPYRANLFALKSLGVTHLIAGSAVGSLREAIRPRDLVIPDQIIDKTHRRASTFFEDFVVHAEMAEPFSPELRRLLLQLAPKIPTRVHDGGTYVCMEGPAFSTRAESHMHRAWGADLIGMTLMPEAKLAREAEIAYAAVCLATDYDCWKPQAGNPEGLGEEIRATLKAASGFAIELIRLAIAEIGTTGLPCSAHHALKHGIWTNPALIPAPVRERLRPLTVKYLG